MSETSRDQQGAGVSETPAPHGSSTIDLTHSPFGKFVLKASRGLAMAGGVFLLLAIGVTLLSVAGRYLLGKPVPGDYEIVEIGCAVAVFLFFPFTHASGSNIAAEFFTSGLPPRVQLVIDMIHEIIFGAIAALLAWRLSHGLADKFASGDTSILIKIPLWWAFSVAVVCFVLIAVICVFRFSAGLGALRETPSGELRK